MPDQKENLEKRLKALSRTPPADLADWHFSPSMRQRVHQRVSSFDARLKLATKNLTTKPRRWWSLALASGCAALLLFLFISRPALLVNRQNPPPILEGELLETLRINLDESGAEEMVSIIRMRGEAGVDQLLALIWSHEPENDAWKLVRYEPLPRAEVLPMEVATQQHRGKIVLIHLRDAKGNKLSPLVVGIKNSEGLR